MVKKTLMLISILGILFSINACSQFNIYKDKDSGSAQEDSREKAKTLNIWIMPNSPDAEKDFMSLIDPYLRDKPYLKVVPTVLSWESAWNKISLSISGGDAPDITQLGTTWLAAIASTGELVDLTDKYNEEDFIPACLRTTTIENNAGSKGETQRFAMPWFLDTRALYYRKDAIFKAGINPDADFKDWNSFKAALVKLKGLEVNGKKITPMGMGAKNDWNIIHDFSWWIWGAGGDYLSPDYKQCTINSKEAVQGIKFYTDLANEGLLSKEALQRNSTEAGFMFNNGDFATMIVSPTSNIDINDNIGVSLIPEGPNGRFSFLGGSVLSIYKSSKNIDEAEKLLNYLASSSAQIEYSKRTLLLPSVKAAYNDPYISESPVLSVFKKQIEFAKSYPSIPAWGPVETIFKEGFTKVWDAVLGGDDTTRDARVLKQLNDTVNNVNKELNK
ncbi:MAG: extracellular solute-binding protein [Clostridia bacterium]|nr:extracellular solute-binding protein [Clostridia bacterium]